jgi:hypothetical protein
MGTVLAAVSGGVPDKCDVCSAAGYTIVKDVLTPAQCRQARETLLTCAERFGEGHSHRTPQVCCVGICHSVFISVPQNCSAI